MFRAGNGAAGRSALYDCERAFSKGQSGWYREVSFVLDCRTAALFLLEVFILESEY